MLPLADTHPNSQGSLRLLEHCSAFDGDRPSAQSRLEQVLGGKLARLLVRALTREPS
jgi:hypothetical protein